MTTYSGTILDATTEKPIPFASVIYRSGNNFLNGTAADSNGYFSLMTSIPATEVDVSAAGYKTWTFPASTYQHRFELEQKEYSGEVPTVYAPAKKKQFPWAVALGLLLLFAIKKR